MLVRVWETSGSSGPLTLIAPGYRQATETDLLERERGPLRHTQDHILLHARGYGFSAVKLQHRPPAGLCKRTLSDRSSCNLCLFLRFA